MKGKKSRAASEFEKAVTPAMRRTLAGLGTPRAIQGFLDGLDYSPDDFYRCPLRVLKEGIGHCFDGAVFAAMALERIGSKPLIIDMIPNKRDDDHVLAVFKIDGCFGAIAKSNFAGLRFREPIHRTLREMVVSYFEQYYNVAGEKTLRGYTVPLNLSVFRERPWMTEDGPLEAIAGRLDQIRRFDLLSRKMTRNLSPVDPRSLAAGLTGSNPAGLFQPD